MGRIAVCLSCPEYQKGGYCRKKHKDVGALQPACQEMTDLINTKEDEDMRTKIPTPESKRCPKCGRELPSEAFRPREESKDGLQSWCKECTNEGSRRYMATKKAEKNGEAIPDFGPWPYSQDPEQEVKAAEPEPETAAPAPEAKEGPAPNTSCQDPALENFSSQKLADELRARGYHVDAFREIRTIEQL